MLTLIFQLFTSGFAAAISYYELKKRFRETTEIGKVEAKILFVLIFAFSIVTIFATISGYMDSESDKNKLQTNFDKLSIENDKNAAQLRQDNHVLKNNIDANTLRVIKNAGDNAIKAGHQLVSTADSIKDILKGSNDIPSLSIDIGKKKLSLLIENHSKLPLYTTIKFIDYSAIEKCKVSNDKKFVSQSCFNESSEQFEGLTVAPSIKYTLQLSNSPEILQKENYKFSVFFLIRENNYRYDVFYKAKFKGSTVSPAAYIHVLKKVGSEYVFFRNQFKTDPYNIDWASEFSLNKAIPSEFI